MPYFKLLTCWFENIWPLPFDGQTSCSIADALHDFVALDITNITEIKCPYIQSAEIDGALEPYWYFVMYLIHNHYVAVALLFIFRLRREKDATLMIIEFSPDVSEPRFRGVDRNGRMLSENAMRDATLQT